MTRGRTDLVVGARDAGFAGTASITDPAGAIGPRRAAVGAHTARTRGTARATLTTVGTHAAGGAGVRTALTPGAAGTADTALAAHTALPTLIARGRTDQVAGARNAGSAGTADTARTTDPAGAIGPVRAGIPQRID